MARLTLGLKRVVMLQGSASAEASSPAGLRWLRTAARKAPLLASLPLSAFTSYKLHQCRKR